MDQATLWRKLARCSIGDEHCPTLRERIGGKHTETPKKKMDAYPEAAGDHLPPREAGTRR